jgi:hypothetical protein
MVSDENRLELHRLLEDSLGQRAAGLLMAQLPPVGWPDLATKADLAQIGSELRTEMGDLRTELHTEMAGLRTEMVEFRADMRTELRSELSGIRVEMAGLKTGVVEIMNQQLTKMTWTMLTLMVTFIAAAFAVTHVS